MDDLPANIADQQKLFEDFFYEGEHVTTEFVVNEKWYVISRAWFEKWKAYIRKCQSKTGAHYNRHDEQPGPIDVSLITNNHELKPGLLINVDVVLIPEVLLDKLIDWYGVVGDKGTVPVRAVYMGSDKEPSLDLYPPKLCLIPKSNGFKKIEIELNSKNTIGDVKIAIKKENPNTTTGKIVLYDAKNLDKLSDDDTATLKECSLDGSVELHYDIMFGSSSLPNGDGPPKTSVYSNSSKLPVGACGLSNLGNTCFMNSAIQCISHVAPLRDYFLSGKYKSDINKTNRLGSGGYVALAFAELIRSMWDENNRGSAFVPRDLKMHIGKVAPQFVGYHQHDAQELMNVLLDFLNEDLNKIKQKPYIEIKDANGRPDDEVAQEAWSDYRKRNDSIIVDLFHGLLKSTVTCPQCNYVSVTFDPFATLSVPLPTLDIHIFMWPHTKHILHVPSTCRAIDIITSLKRIRPLEDEHDYIITAVSEDDLRVIHPGSTENLHMPNLHVFELPRGSVVPVQLQVDGKPDLLRFLVSFGEHKAQFSRTEVVEAIKMQLAKLSPECANSFDALYTNEALQFKPDEETFSINPDDAIIVSMPKSLEFDHTTEVKRHDVQLINCLDLFLSTEQLSERDPWYCKECKAHRRAYKKFDIWFLPRVLIIQLKRYRNAYRVHKNEAFVDYPVTGLEVCNAKGKKYVFDLVAVSNHMGGLGGGHYTALGKNNGKWYNFDDSFVSQVQPNHVVNRSGYCLVYVQRDSSKGVAATTNGMDHQYSDEGSPDDLSS